MLVLINDSISLDGEIISKTSLLVSLNVDRLDIGSSNLRAIDSIEVVIKVKMKKKKSRNRSNVNDANGDR